MFGWGKKKNNSNNNSTNNKQPTQQLTETPVQKLDIFSDIIGYEDVKEYMQSVLAALDAVHMLFSGPPGVAKTRWLRAVEKKYNKNALFIDCASMSGPGLLDTLFSLPEEVMKEGIILLLDEIGALSRNDQRQLYSLMTDGKIKQTKSKKIREAQIKCRVFATCNETTKLEKPLLSRFAIHLEFPPYTKEQYIHIMSTAILNKKFTTNEQFARYIAETIYTQFGGDNPRLCESVAKTCKDETTVQRFVLMQQKYSKEEQERQRLLQKQQEGKQ